MVIGASRDPLILRAIKRAAKEEMETATGLRQLRGMVTRLQPWLVVLDSYLERSPTGSGLECRAVELIPELLRASPTTAIVGLVYSPSRQEIDELAMLHAVACVDVEKDDYFDRRLRDAIEYARESSASRRSSIRLRRLRH